MAATGAFRPALEATWLTPTHNLASTYRDRSRWFVLASITLAAFVTTLDVSILNVALAPISRDFGIAVDRLEWIVITYSLTLVALTPISGRVSDGLGRTRVFTLGFISFIIASLLCSLAWNLPSLVLFRALQGMSAAMFQGNNQAIITAIFPPHERGRAFGINSVAVGAGIVSGPVIGGLLTAWLGWRSIFWVNVPVGLIGFVLGRALLPPDEKRREKFVFDWRGATLFVGGIVPLMFGLGTAANEALSSPSVAVPVMAGAALLLLFAGTQARAETPLMPPDIFRSPGVALGLTAAFISFTAGNMATFLTPYVLQQGLGFSVQEAGLVMTASPLAMLLIAPLSGYLSDVYGPRPFTVAGLISMVIALLTLSQMEPGWTWADVYWRLFLQGMGWGLFNSPNWATIMGAVPPTVAGVTGGINATVRNLGHTTAVAVAAAYFHRLSMGLLEPALLVGAYQATMILAASFAAVGLVPTVLRRLPESASRRGRSKMAAD